MREGSKRPTLRTRARQRLQIQVIDRGRDAAYLVDGCCGVSDRSGGGEAGERGDGENEEGEHGGRS